MSSLLQPVIYHHNIRQKINYSATLVKHVFAQKCMRFCIPDILNKSSSIITDKIKTHSRKGFLVYLKCFLVNAYNSIILFNTKLLYMFKNCCFVIHGALWTLALFGPIFEGVCPGGFLGCSETPLPPSQETEQKYFTVWTCYFLATSPGTQCLTTNGQLCYEAWFY